MRDYYRESAMITDYKQMYLSSSSSFTSVLGTRESVMRQDVWSSLH